MIILLRDTFCSAISGLASIPRFIIKGTENSQWPDQLCCALCSNYVIIFVKSDMFVILCIVIYFLEERKKHVF